MIKLKYLKIIYIPFLLIALSFSWVTDVFAASLKKTIAVSRFEISSSIKDKSKFGTAVADQLAEALIKSGKFVVEQQVLSDMPKKQDVASVGKDTVSKTAQTEKNVPAQILIKGTVTELESDKGGGSVGLGIGIGGFSLSSSGSVTTQMAIMLIIIETASGKVIESARVEGNGKSRNLGMGLVVGNVGFGTSGFKKTSLGKAMQMTVDNAVRKIVETLEQVPFGGKITKIDGQTIYIDAGSRNGVSEGSVFNSFSLGEEMIDPDTGVKLGLEKNNRGSIKITSVMEKHSKTSLIDGELIEKGFVFTE